MSIVFIATIKTKKMSLLSLLRQLKRIATLDATKTLQELVDTPRYLSKELLKTSPRAYNELREASV